MALVSRRGPLVVKIMHCSSPRAACLTSGRGEAEGSAIQQVVDEARREAQGQQRRHEGRGAQPPRRIAEEDKTNLNE